MRTTTKKISPTSPHTLTQSTLIVWSSPEACVSDCVVRFALCDAHACRRTFASHMCEMAYGMTSKMIHRSSHVTAHMKWLSNVCGEIASMIVFASGMVRKQKTA